MAIRIYPRSEQVYSYFNQGEIEEYKPIGFPQETGQLQAYSNLFYWAFAWSGTESTIAEHPHKGFEIISYIIQGKLDHYDNKIKEWKSLEKGSLQVINSGKGITHAERFYEDTQIFQIWFDPDMSKSFKQEPDYNSFSMQDFPVSIGQGYKKTTIVGGNSPVKLNALGIEIKEYVLAYKVHNFKLDDTKVFSAFLIDGQLEINGQLVQTNDFVKIEDENTLIIKANKESKLFVITSPKIPGYKTCF